MSYIYQADIYCDDCGNEIKRQCMQHERRTRDILSRRDSEQWPQEVIGSNESDCPQHCGAGSSCPNFIRLEDGTKVGMFLENELTQEGYEYIRDEWKEFLQFGHGNDEVLKLWLNYYGIYYHENLVKNSYPKGECPDCYDEIPDDVVEGQECAGCGHAFFSERKDDDSSQNHL